MCCGLDASLLEEIFIITSSVLFSASAGVDILSVRCGERAFS